MQNWWCGIAAGSDIGCIEFIWGKLGGHASQRIARQMSLYSEPGELHVPPGDRTLFSSDIILPVKCRDPKLLITIERGEGLDYEPSPF